MSDPAGTYRARLAERESVLVRLEARQRGLGSARLVVFILLVLTGWIVVTRPGTSPSWLLPPLTGFVALVIIHARTRQAATRARRGTEFYRRGLSRLDGTWVGTGRGGTDWLEPGHLFATDLDLFGAGSLFELLCEAQTLAGERALAGWLQHPADAATIRARQEAVTELAPRIDFREALAVLGHEVRGSFDERPLVQWAAAESPPFPPGAVALCRLAAAGTVVTVAGALLGAWTWTPVLGAVLAVGAVGAAFSGHRRAAIAGVGVAARELGDLAELIARIEAEPVTTPYLQQLQSRLTARTHPASRQIWRLRRLIGLLDTRGNQLVMLILPLILWTTQIAIAISRWRREVGVEVAEWIAALGEFEAIASLAGHAFEQPDAVIPVMGARPGFRAEGLGHPLLEVGGVRNDLVLGEERRLVVVSGSNMSGKSTLLRSVGTAVVMAQMGARVCARRFEMEELVVGASIATHDSLQEGSSRFYAEISRLRQILSLTEGGRPVLFLLDEMLSGTNSHDRRLGAGAVVRRLVDRGAIGIVTTHDLALSQIATDLGARAANVHFRDHLEGDRIAFDYQMHPGVVERGNALALMRSIGLEV